MVSLPIERVTPYARAYTYTGQDYFGPVTVTNRRQREKRWVALFMPFYYVFEILLTELPLASCSDNGTNLVGIAKQLQSLSNFTDRFPAF